MVPRACCRARAGVGAARVRARAQKGTRRVAVPERTDDRRRTHLDPVDVVDEVLHTVDEPSVRPQLHLAHDVLERDEVPYVYNRHGTRRSRSGEGGAMESAGCQTAERTCCHRVGEVLSRRVEVDNVHTPPQILAVRVHHLTECRLAASGGPYDELRTAAHYATWASASRQSVFPVLPHSSHLMTLSSREETKEAFVSNR